MVTTRGWLTIGHLRHGMRKRVTSSGTLTLTLWTLTLDLLASLRCQFRQRLVVGGHWRELVLGPGTPDRKIGGVWCVGAWSWACGVVTADDSLVKVRLIMARNVVLPAIASDLAWHTETTVRQTQPTLVVLWTKIPRSYCRPLGTVLIYLSYKIHNARLVQHRTCG